MSQNYIKLTDLAYGYGTKILRQAVNLTITTGDLIWWLLKSPQMPL